MLNGNYTTKIDFEYIKDLPNQGANSHVFLGRDKQLDNILVYKKIKKANLAIDVYFKEARLLYNNRHQFIVSVNYGSYDDESIIIGMPYYKNGSIKDKINNARFLSVGDVIRYSSHFLTGLNHIHSNNLIHFDIKPDNILISDSDEALLSDFGLSKYMINGSVRPDKMYTLHYVPEVIKGEDADQRSDIYQVGLTMYRMLNGYNSLASQVNDTTDLNDILTAKFPDRKAYLPHIPQKMRNIVNKCIEPNPLNRYQNVLQIKNDLSALEGDDLFWEYQMEEDSEKWERESDSIKYVVTVLKSVNYSIFTEKITPSRKQKVSNYCLNNISKIEKDKVLKEIFKKL